jgi:acetylornithine/succinyldiaminopimelate/putrescine aminotransferase
VKFLGSRQTFKSALKQVSKKKKSTIREVRGQGLFLGIEFGCKQLHPLAENRLCNEPNERIWNFNAC